MRNFTTQHSTSFFARHRVLVPVLILLLVTSVGFAASGAFELIRSWFLTITVNGEVVHEGEVVTDENGNATLTVPMPPSTGETTTISLSGTGNGAPDGTTVDVSVASDGEQATVTIAPAEKHE
jgi:hypothetical protein